MTSSAKQQQQLMNGVDDEDPYKTQGHIELKIGNLTEFAQQEVGSRRLSDPVFVRGVPWKILVITRQLRLAPVAQNGQRPRCLGYFLQCDNGTDPFGSVSAKAQLKALAQKEGKADHVRHIEHTFHAKKNDWGFANFMTFEALMNPESGWYDEQADSIALALDFTVGSAEGIAKYVPVAQNELTLNNVPMNFSLQIGNLHWLVNYDELATGDNWEGKNALVLSCKDVAKGRADKVLLELIGYLRGQEEDPKSEEAYSPFPGQPLYRHLFTRKHNSLTVDIPGGRNNLLFTVRVLKERNLFPDFNKPSAMVGRFPGDVALRVGDRQFRVNRQFLSVLSPFFDRMLNDLYPDATKQEVELSLNTHSAELFEDFLLVLCVNDVLPNSMNVAALFKLADFYDADVVRVKCDQHLRMAREMPIEKRVLLARNHGSEQTQDMIMDGVNLEQAKRINLMFIKNRSI